MLRMMLRFARARISSIATVRIGEFSEADLTWPALRHHKSCIAAGFYMYFGAHTCMIHIQQASLSSRVRTSLGLGVVHMARLERFDNLCIDTGRADGVNSRGQEPRGQKQLRN